MPDGMEIALTHPMPRVNLVNKDNAIGSEIAMALLLYVLALSFVISTAILIEIGMLDYAAERLGIDRRRILWLLILCFLGSYINVPVAEYPAEAIHTTRVVSHFGRSYNVPVVENRPGTIMAVNIGGAVIPVCFAVYLIVKNRLYTEAGVGVLAVTTLVHFLARPVPGIGISVPIFLPPITAAIVAVLLSWKHSAALAYVSGTLGTLIGGDLLNLALLPALGAPVASIGGAGTFDGVFLTGIFAMLLA